MREWKQVTTDAAKAWEAFDFEKTVQICLDYLHQSPNLFQSATNSFKTYSDKELTIVFACGGSGTRWGNFSGKPKHRIDCGDGIPIIQRSISQFRKHLPKAQCHLLIGSEQVSQYSDINNANILLRRMPPDGNLAIEILSNETVAGKNNAGLLWVYGDIFFSHDAIYTICERIHQIPGRLALFGRKTGNSKYQTRWGEVFGWYIPEGKCQHLLEWYQLISMIYKGSTITRQTSWEIISLMTFCAKHGITNADEALKSGLSPLAFSSQIDSVFKERSFTDEIWVEIDDETDDFDYPIEYMKRLFWNVERVGKNQNS